MNKNTGVGVEQVLIGSAAINRHDPAILKRSAKDQDFLALKALRDNNVDYISGEGILNRYPMAELPTLDELYTIKVSHSFWIIDYNSWHKHLRDIHLLKTYGCKLIPELYTVAYEEWARRKGPKIIDLNQDKKEFFTGAVRRKYDHDFIHASVAFQTDPLYKKILADDVEVLISRKKFEALSHMEKVMLVREEVSVLSLERDLIPQEKTTFEKIDLYSSYGKQLRMLITQYSKGYFPLWIVENYFEVFKPGRDYWKLFLAAL